MAEKKPRKPREKKPKQGYLSEDMAPVTDPEVDAAADAYIEARDARMELSKEEAKAQAALMLVMARKKLRAYEYAGRLVEVFANEKVRVKRMKDDENGDGEE